MGETRGQTLSPRPGQSRPPPAQVGSTSTSLLALHPLALSHRPSLGALALSCYLGLVYGTHIHKHRHRHTHFQFIPGNICGSCRKVNRLQTPLPSSLREGNTHLSFPVGSTSGPGGPAGLDCCGAAGRLEGPWPWGWLCCGLQGRPSHPGSSITG